MKGLDGLIYIASTSEASGRATVTLTFDNATNPDIAQVQVQNKLQLALPLLPQAVQRQGINVSKSRTGFLQIVGFVSADGSMGRNDIADYVIAQHRRSAEPRPGRRLRCRCSARRTPCASGSTRTGWRPTT